MQPVLLLVDTLETQEFSQILSYVILIQKEKTIAGAFGLFMLPYQGYSWQEKHSVLTRHQGDPQLMFYTLDD